MFFKIQDFRDKVSDLYEKGVQPGEYIGFNTMKEHYSVKLGYTTYLVGAPASGKSEWHKQVLINLSQYYGWKHVLFSPETGNKEEIVAELCHTYIGKPFYKANGYGMSDMEMYKAMDFLQEHFFIIDPEDKDLTIPEFYKAVDQLEDLYGIKVHTTTGDPFNEFKHDFSKDEGRQDLYIERILGDVRKNAKKHNRHNFIITHCRDQKPVEKDGVVYFPPPTARDYAGGQAWFRKGMAMICVWRPPYKLNDENGMPYKENETHIIVQKVKPKGTGKRGTVRMYYDFKSSRFYEMVHGLQKWAAPEGREPEKIEPNMEFEKDTNEYPF
jgi:hypothetical protein